MEETQVIEQATSFFDSVTWANIVPYLVAFCKNVLVALVIWFVGRFLIQRLLKVVRKIMKHRNVEPSLASFLDSMLSICLHFIIIIAVVSVLGIETSSFVALFASAGVAIGMALSGTLQNFAGGVMILLFRPFKVGDYIEAAGYAGTVKYIQMFSTVLTTPDNQTIIIPNGGLSTSSLKNYSSEGERRVDINVEVAYGTKPEEVRKILDAIIQSDDRIVKDGLHAPASPMTQMAASSIVFQLRVWTSTENYWGVLFDTTERIYSDLTAAGIQIPFQQLDVHVVNS